MFSTRNSLRYAALLLAQLLIVCTLPGCGGRSGGTVPVGADLVSAQDSGAAGFSGAAVPGRHSDIEISVEGSNHGQGRPRHCELEALLYDELARLGRDPAKVTVAAPQGSDNVVFNLSAEVIDPDGEGGDPPTGIALSWTEQLVGDYDQNGEVNASDLTPLGVYWEATIEYDDPSLHGGFKYWPEGDPDGAGADNWRLARVDGNRDGQVYTYDITPIAVHFKERLSGYRVYRRKAEHNSATRIAEIKRSFATQAGVLVYSHTDHPPEAGTYEYYVTGYSAGEGQSGINSNLATATLTTGYADLSAPIWDDVAGIESVIDNGDNTVTVTWGGAQDIAIPPAPSSPPVNFNIYYSTQDPLDFSTAAVVHDASSPWTSPQLIAGQEYFFAVRVQDSAFPPNEDLNTNQLSVTVTGENPVEDHDPPVWTELMAYEGAESSQNYIEGIKEIEVLDGMLRITRAEAHDILNPPVHYDLFYIADEIADSVLYEDGELEGQPRPEALVIEDIPPVMDFPWENRHEVHLHIRARDSAAPPNQEQNDFERSSAPIHIERIRMDSELPGIDPDTVTRIDAQEAIDPFNHRSYVVYTARHGEVDEHEVWFLDIDADTGVWTSKLLYSAQPDEDLNNAVKISRSWTGDIWVRWAYKRGSDPSTIVYQILRTTGQWEQWDAVDPPFSWYSELFDHNGNPVTLEISPSDVQENRFKVLYSWWDEDSGQWVTEVAVDPGTVYASSFAKPDGTLQLLMSGEARPPGDETPTKARLAERTPDGTWSVIMEGVGGIGASYFPATWGYEVEWSGGISIDSQSGYLLYNQSGYSILPYYYYRDDIRVYGRLWPAAGGGYHILPDFLYIDDKYIRQHIEPRNYSGAIYKSEYIRQLDVDMYTMVYSPLDGYFAYTAFEPDLQSRTYELILHKCPVGESIFKP